MQYLCVWVRAHACVNHSQNTLKLGFLISLETTMVSFVLIEIYPFIEDINTELYRIIYIIQNSFIAFNIFLPVSLNLALSLISLICSFHLTIEHL